MAGYELATAYVNLTVGTSTIASQIKKELAGGQREAVTKGRATGAEFSKAFQSAKPIDFKEAADKAARDAERATARVKQASKEVETAREREAQASRRVGIEQQKLDELRSSGKAKASQLLAAEDRLETAKTKLAHAIDKTKLATQRSEFAVEQEARAKQTAADASKQLERANEKLGTSTQTAGRGFLTLKDRISQALRGNFKDAFKRIPNDADDAADKVEDRFDRAGKESGDGFSGAFKGAIGGIAAYMSFDAIKDGLISVAQESGDLEQSVGAIDSIFKSSSAQMHAWSKSAKTAVGLSRNEYNELGTLIGAQLKNAGTAMEDLGPKTNELIGLGADLSSMFGGTTREAVESISSALKGERDPIEKYGVSLKQASIDAKAAELGFKKVGGSFDQEAQAAATLALIMEQTTDAHGNFAAESDTFAHKQQVAAAQWADLKAQIGNVFLPAFTQAMGFVVDNGIPALESLVSGLQALGKWVVANAVWLKPLAMIVGGVAVAWGAYAAGQWVATTATAAFGGALAFVTSTAGVWIIAIGAIVGALVWFFTQTELGKAIWLKAWAAMKFAVATLVEWFKAYVVPSFRLVFTAIGSAVSWLWTAIVKPVFGFIGALIGFAWNGIIKPIFVALVWYFQNVLGPIFTWLWSFVVRPVFLLIGAYIRLWWASAKVVFQAVVWFFQNVLGPIFTWLWNAIVKPVFSFIKAFIQVWWISVRIIFQAVVAFVRWSLGPVFTWLLNNVIRPVWSGIKATISGVWNFLRDKVFNPLATAIRDTLPKAFNAGKNAIKRAFEGIRDAAKAPVRFVIQTVMNDGIIKNFNKIARFFKVGEVGEIRLPDGFATGGWTGPGGRLTPAGVVHADEFVIRKASRRRFEKTHPGVLDHINRHGVLPGYARGGSVGTLSDSARWWQSLGARITEFGAWGQRVGRHSRGSLHYSGRAYDVNFGPGGQNATEMKFFDSHVAEFKRKFPGVRVIWRAPGHYNHLHADNSGGADIGSAGPGGSNGGGMDPLSLLKPFVALKDKLGKIVHSPFGELVKATAKKVIDIPIEWIKNKAGAVGDFASKVVDNVKAGTAKAQVRSVAAGFGWGLGKQWDAIDWLVQRESSWNPSAENPRSSAKGLFQKMTSLHGPVESTPAGQALWGLKYIKGRFGTPVNAMNFHRRNNWYDKGGVVKPTLFDGGGFLEKGMLAVHGTKAPDAVLTATQWKHMAKIADSVEEAKPGLVIQTLNVKANSEAEGRNAVRGIYDELRRLERGGKYAGV